MKGFLLLGAVISIGAAPQPAAVQLDQLGFLAHGAKRAIVVTDSRTPVAWRLIGADGAVAAHGTTTVFGADAASGDHVQRIDFSTVEQSGTIG